MSIFSIFDKKKIKFTKAYANLIHYLFICFVFVPYIYYSITLYFWCVAFRLAVLVCGKKFFNQIFIGKWMKNWSTVRDGGKTMKGRKIELFINGQMLMVICGSFLKWIPGNNICRGNVVQQCLVTMDWPFPHFLVNEVQYLPPS